MSDGDFDIKLLRVIYKPAVIGVPPDPGTEYLEADFALTVLPHPQGFDAPVVYIPSKQPAGYIGCGLQLAPVDTQSNNPLSGDNMAPRNVRVPGKQSIESDAAICLAVGSGATCNPHAGQTDDDYALFEIPAGDNGHIVWESDNGQSYTFEW